MKKNAKIAIVCIIAAVGIFGYVQYMAASHLHVSIVQSKVVERTNEGTLYNLQLEFKNPSLLVLDVGKTDFILSANGEDLGTGILQPSTIPAMGDTVSQTPFLADNKVLDKYDNSDNIPNLRLIGTSKYDFGFTSLSIPFTYYPTEQEAREFIHGS